jgi:septum formation protein
MANKPDLILASKSPYRAQILSSAGVEFKVRPALIDERAVEAPLIESNQDPTDISLVLAQAKAMTVSEKIEDAVVIGSDQTLTFENQLLHKPQNMDQARRRLLLLSGKTHTLNSAVALAKNGEILWYHTDTATIAFRDLDPVFIGRHLAKVGDKALTSVGAYQIEGEGVQLFDSIKGDFFAIMGLPLIPLLKILRELEIIDG